MNTKRWLRSAGVAFCIGLAVAGCGGRTDPSAQAVASELGGNKLGITASDLRTKPNPKGKGTFVYVAKTDFGGVERRLVWLVLDGKAYALNGASKDVTPRLPWPREASAEDWKATGLDQFMATEALQIVFGS